MSGPSTPLLEIALRVAILYLSLIVMVRATGKRGVGQLSPLDLLAMLLLSETVSPALTAQDQSLTGSLTAAATLLLLTVAIGRLTARFAWAERWIDGCSVAIARDGRPCEEAMRTERITRQELDSAIRKSGLEDLSGVQLATVEPDGSISIVPRSGS